MKIAETGTVHHETGMTPRELTYLVQRLSFALRGMMDVYGTICDTQELGSSPHGAVHDRRRTAEEAGTLQGHGMIDAKYEVNKTPAFGPGGERWVYEVSRIDITGHRVSLSYYGDQTTADNIVKLLQAMPTAMIPPCASRNGKSISALARSVARCLPVARFTFFRSSGTG